MVWQCWWSLAGAGIPASGLIKINRLWGCRFTYTQCDGAQLFWDGSQIFKTRIWLWLQLFVLISKNLKAILCSKINFFQLSLAIKVQCHKILDLEFFHEFNPDGFLKICLMLEIFYRKRSKNWNQKCVLKIYAFFNLRFCRTIF